MKVLSLFSGAGLGDLGLTMAGMEIVGQCEIDEYCQKLLALRWPDVPKWKDVRIVTGDEVRTKCGSIDIISGGFPCQPFSVAGKQKGKSDDRHLWPEMRRIISEVKPPFVLGENVPGLINLALDDVLHDLESLGYETATFVFPAHALGAPHRRDRLWIVGYAEHFRRAGIQESRGVGARNDAPAGPQRPEQSPGSGGGQGGDENLANSKSGKSDQRRRRDLAKTSEGRESLDASIIVGGEDVADTRSKSRRSGLREIGEVENGNKSGNCGGPMANSTSITKRKSREEFQQRGVLADGGWWAVEPDVGRVAHGVPNRVDRLKALGNGQVVHCVKFLGEKIMEFNKQQEGISK